MYASPFEGNANQTDKHTHRSLSLSVLIGRMIGVIRPKHPANCFIMQDASAVCGCDARKLFLNIERRLDNVTKGLFEHQGRVQL